MKQAIVALAGTVDPVVVEDLVAALRGGRKNCSACLQGVKLGPQPTFATRPLHPTKADISGPPSDVAEGPMLSKKYPK